MQISIKGTNIDLTDPIDAYVQDKIGGLDKFLDKDAFAYVEVGRESMHHNKGEDVFMAEVKIKAGESDFFAREHNADLYAAIDAVKEEIQRVIKQDKNKKQTLFIRGARKIKKRIKGMKPWWPFGGK